MNASSIPFANNKQARRQQIFVCFLLLPLVLFAFSGFTLIPNIAQTPNLATGTSLQHTNQLSEILTSSATDVSCSDVITLESFSWSGIKIYFNACALEHITAIVAGVSAAGAGASAFGLVSLVCQECAPLIPWIAGLVSGATAGIDFLQYASQDCGGAILDISLGGGIKFESACSTSSNKS